MKSLGSAARRPPKTPPNGSRANGSFDGSCCRGLTLPPTTSIGIGEAAASPTWMVPTSAWPTARGWSTYVQLRDWDDCPFTHDIWVETEGPPAILRLVRAGSGTLSGSDEPSTVMVYTTWSWSPTRWASTSARTAAEAAPDVTPSAIR